MNRTIKTLFLIFVSCVSFSMIGFGQDTASSAQKQSLNPAGQMSKGVNYFKIEVGMHIMDCPVLPSRLQEKLMGLNGIKDYNKDMKTQSITFNIPEGVITKEQIVTIASGCGFPAQSINVLVDSKPFVN